MEFPERIYLFDCNPSLAIKLDGDTEYIRKDIVDDMLKTAEDHAYFAGGEAMREKAISRLESLCKEWHLHESTEAKYRLEAYKELLEILKED